MLTLLFAGHDTSSSSLTRIFHHLHNHPEAAERLRREQVRVCLPPVSQLATAMNVWSDAKHTRGEGAAASAPPSPLLLAG